VGAIKDGKVQPAQEVIHRPLAAIRETTGNDAVTKGGDASLEGPYNRSAVARACHPIILEVISRKGYKFTNSLKRSAQSQDLVEKKTLPKKSAGQKAGERAVGLGKDVSGKRESTITRRRPSSSFWGTQRVSTCSTPPKGRKITYQP